MYNEDIWDKINEFLKIEDYEKLKQYVGIHDLSENLIDALIKLKKEEPNLKELEMGIVLRK